MSKSHYHLDPAEKAVVKDTTGEKMYPSCFDDLAIYYSYVCGTEGVAEGQKVLKAVFKGEKVISNLVEFARNHGKGLS